MILVDTSVWIRTFLGRAGYADRLEQMLAGGMVGGHELVHGELLAGDTGGREPMLRKYSELRWAPCLPHDQVAAWARERKLCGRGAGWIDLHLLAAAQAQSWRLWTADERLAALADELKLSGQP